MCFKDLLQQNRCIENMSYTVKIYSKHFTFKHKVGFKASYIKT